jgi:exodeoxyribonuclease VII large subunit
MSSRFIATVSQINKRIALNLKKDTELADISIGGEISNFVCHYKSGHIYYTLKDSQSSLKCVMFANEAAGLTFMPENGQNVVARGRVQVYEAGGVYQLYTSSIEIPEEKKDEESLFAAFLKLKEKLQNEGVFSNNRVLPAYPKKICIITAKDSAALQDMLVIFGRRYPVLEVLLIPALVQGKTAPASLIKSIRAANNCNADLIIIARGGGSAEDLWVFNDEELAREIYASSIPVVSGVGHETDFTIADFAADLRAPTPSAAAELVTPDLSELPVTLDNLLNRLKRQVSGIVGKQQDKLEYLSQRINERIKNIIVYKNKELEAVTELLNALNPEKVFMRGYAAVFDKNNKAIKNAYDVEINNELSVKLANGSLTVIVKSRGDL